MECCGCTRRLELQEEKAFADYTTLHGMHRVAAVKSWHSRVFWLLACLGAWTFLFWQLSELVTKYLEHGVNTNVNFVEVSEFSGLV